MSRAVIAIGVAVIASTLAAMQAAMTEVMMSHESQDHIERLQIDGEALARAYPNPRHFKKLVERLKRHGASDGDIVRALAGAKTLISALRVNR
jgi:hypothetical protein